MSQKPVHLLDVILQPAAHPTIKTGWNIAIVADETPVRPFFHDAHQAKPRVRRRCYPVELQANIEAPDLELCRAVHLEERIARLVIRRDIAHERGISGALERQ